MRLWPHRHDYSRYRVVVNGLGNRTSCREDRIEQARAAGSVVAVTDDPPTLGLCRICGKFPPKEALDDN